MSDEQRNQENEEIASRLKAGGGAVGILGGTGWGSAKLAEHLDKKQKEVVQKGGKSLKYMAERGLTPEELESIGEMKSIAKYMALIGGSAYAGTKAYEHFKNKNKKKEE